MQLNSMTAAAVSAAGGKEENYVEGTRFLIVPWYNRLQDIDS